MQSASIYEGIGEWGALVGGLATPEKLANGDPIWQWHIIGGWGGPIGQRGNWWTERNSTRALEQRDKTCRKTAANLPSDGLK
jgi:hypothetical protein